MQETAAGFEIYSNSDRCTPGPARAEETETNKSSIASLRILDRATPRISTTSSVYDPTSVEASARNTVPTMVEAPLSDAVEHRLLEILANAPALGETIDAAFKRKEHKVAAVFGQLSWPQCRTLYKRLSSPPANDQLATQFARLVGSRRARLLGFLADVRRREALAARR